MQALAGSIHRYVMYDLESFRTLIDIANLSVEQRNQLEQMINQYSVGS